jgi:mono/diheme cytochrome c family protein
MRRALAALAGLVLLGGAAFWLLTAPRAVEAEALAGLSGDAARGERVFGIGGCAGCHSAEGAKGEDRLVLSGGRRFATEFGTFVAPNVSPDPQAGIGGWSFPDFATAVLRGVSPDGRHYYPAFPYASYVRMTMQDVADLWAYWETLPASDAASAPHEIGFPYSIRRGLGLWKLVGVDPAWVGQVPEGDEILARGRYLVEGPGHCGECHTPRDATGVLDRDRWLKGAPNPEGPGTIPDISPTGKDVSGWSAAEIADYLGTGFTPEYDTVGGLMVEVVENLSGLPDEDRAAIAAYLKALPGGE